MTSSTTALLAPLERFYAAAGLPVPIVETVTADALPLGVWALLRVAGPLTPRLEDHHGEPLALRVLERRRQGDVYGRRIVLVRGDGVPVVLGAIEIDLARLAPALRAQVLDESLPFGHILANTAAHPDAFLRVTADPLIAAALEITGEEASLYGRRRTVLDAEGAIVAAIVEVLAPDRAPTTRAARTGS